MRRMGAIGVTRREGGEGIDGAWADRIDVPERDAVGGVVARVGFCGKEEGEREKGGEEKENNMWDFFLGGGGCLDGI